MCSGTVFNVGHSFFWQCSEPGVVTCMRDTVKCDNTLWLAHVKKKWKSKHLYKSQVCWNMRLRINTVCPPELWPWNREPSHPVPQAERLSKKPPELHPGPAEGWALWRTSFPKITQWFSYLSGGSDWCSQEPACLAWQVKLDRSTVLEDHCSGFYIYKHWFYHGLCTVNVLLLILLFQNFEREMRRLKVGRAGYKLRMQYVLKASYHAKFFWPV